MPNLHNCVTPQVPISSSFVLRPQDIHWQMLCQTFRPVEQSMPTLCSIFKNHLKTLLHHLNPTQWVCYKHQNTPHSNNLCATYFQITPTTIQPTQCSIKHCVWMVMSSGLHLLSITTQAMFLYLEPLLANLHRSLQFREREIPQKSRSTAPPLVLKGLASTRIF
jgi:hypothetical protein